MKFRILESKALNAIAATIPDFNECLYHPDITGAFFYSDALKHVGGDALLEKLIHLGYMAANLNKSIFHINCDDNYYFLSSSEEELANLLQKVKNEI